MRVSMISAAFPCPKFISHFDSIRLAEGVGYKVSFLLNLDMLYWFAIGWVVGTINVLP